MLHKCLFILAHSLGDHTFHGMYKNLMKNQWKKYNELKKEQEIRLRYMVRFAYNNIPFYHKTFKKFGIYPENIKNIEDLEKLPVLTKEIIKNNWEEFKPVNLSLMKYYNRATGGSTGTPFHYRLLKKDRFLMGALWYRGWSYAGYELGDRTVFLAGTSLDVGNKPYIINRIHEIARNIKKLSSFDMGEREIQQYVKIINKFQPKFMHGYASSIYFFAKWLEENDVSIHTPKAVLTTAEKLFPNMRDKIGDVFNCDVYDGYGLNDGGVSAYECSEHNGLHIDTERSIMEIVDEKGTQLEAGEGRILATSLHNYAMPFIRYDTGDLGYIISDQCGCGRGYKLMKEIIGREQEILLTPEGKHIHGEFFTHIFWEIPFIKEFQVIQDSVEKIIINIVPEKSFNDKSLNRIQEIIRTKSQGWEVEFKMVDKIDRTKAGKYKFVINKLKN